jgi:hypothetical protein
MFIQNIFQLNVIFFKSAYWGVESKWVHSARRPLNGLIYPPRVIMMMENLVEWRLAGATEVLGENLPQNLFVHHKSHLNRPGFEHVPTRGKPATNRLSSGAASIKRNEKIEIKSNSLF